MKSIFEVKLTGFIKQWAALENIDRKKSAALCEAAVKYYRTRVAGTAPVIEEQEQRWEASLDAGTPDFSIYDEPLSNLLACFRVYSRNYLHQCQRLGIFADMQNIRTIVDVGCGCGYSTAALKEFFPNAEVFGTELPDSQQWRFAERLGKTRGFSLVADVQKLNRHIDLVFASEYFEHFANPIEHLRGILQVCNPEYLLIANSFNTKAAGHFRLPQNIGREFGKALRQSGYRKGFIKCWNEKPTFWRRA